MELGLTIKDPCHEVSVHPTLGDIPCRIMCRLLRSELDHCIGLNGCQSLPFVVIQINHGHAFVLQHISCANA